MDLLERYYIVDQEFRERFPVVGRPGNQAGDIRATSTKIEHRYKATKSLILYRYTTKNGSYTNYHRRVKLLDGPNKGKIVSDCF